MSKKALFLIVPDGFRDEEYSVPKEILGKNQIEVVTCSTKKGSLTGKRNLTTAQVDIELDKVKAQDYDLILIVGGSPYYWNNPKVISLVKDLYQAGRIVSAICISCAILVQAGVAVGKKVTTFPAPNAIEEIKKLGGIYTAKDVEVDGQIITATGPETAKEFAEEIVKALNPL